MQQEAWRTYLQLALGVTEASRRRATRAARDLLDRGGATAEQLQALAEDIVKTGMANREALTTLIRFELDRALGRVGLATAEQVDELTTRVRDLERQLGQARGTPAASPVPTAGPATPGTRVAKKATKKVAKKAVKKAGRAAAEPAGAASGSATATPEVARAAKAGAGTARRGAPAKATKRAKAAADAPAPRAEAAEAARGVRERSAGVPDPAHPAAGEPA